LALPLAGIDPTSCTAASTTRVGCGDTRRSTSWLLGARQFCRLWRGAC
jgi:hypothetical protein